VYKIDGSDDLEDLHIHMSHVETFETVQGSTDTALPAPIADRPFAFCLRTKSKKAFFFDCRTEELLLDWLECIQKYVKPQEFSTPKADSPVPVNSGRVRQSIIVEGMKMWKDSSVYDELIDGLASISHPLRSVDDIDAPALLENFYIASFLKSRRNNIESILKQKPESARVAYILLEFIQHIPATQFVSAPSKKSPPPLLPKKPKPLPPVRPTATTAADDESILNTSQEEDDEGGKKKPRRIRPKKNMKKIFKKLAKTASGRSVFEMEHAGQSASTSSLHSEGSDHRKDDMEPEDSNAPLEDEMHQPQDLSIDVEEQQQKDDNDEEQVDEINEVFEEEPPTPKIDFAAMQKRRGQVLSNPKAKRLPPVPPPKVKKPLPPDTEEFAEHETTEEQSETNAEEPEDVNPQQSQEDEVQETPTSLETPVDTNMPLESPGKRKMRRKKRTAPSRVASEAVALLEKVDNERETLTNIDAIKDEGNLQITEAPAVPKKKPMGVPMMGFALPQGDLRAVLKKRTGGSMPPFAKSPKETETSETGQFDFRNVLKNRSSPTSPAAAQKSVPATKLEEDNVVSAPDEKPLPATPNAPAQVKIKPETEETSSSSPSETQKAVTPEPSPAEASKRIESKADEPAKESTSTDSPSQKAQKRFSGQIPVFPPMGQESDEGGQVDFRSMLRKTRAAPAKPKEVESGPKQIDFRSVLKKTGSNFSPKQDTQAQSSPKQMDFRSVLRKTKPTAAEKKEQEAGPKQMDYRSLLKKTKKEEEEAS